jgi:hypothetical protein
MKDCAKNLKPDLTNNRVKCDAEVTAPDYSAAWFTEQPAKSNTACSSTPDRTGNPGTPRSNIRTQATAKRPRGSSLKAHSSWLHTSST